MPIGLGEAAYGIPELYPRRLQGPLVANPGCYATSVILALRPLTEAGWIAKDSGVVCDCKSGASGAGKDPAGISTRRSGREFQSLQPLLSSAYARNTPNTRA